MRVLSLLLAAFAIFAASALGWTPEDHEIFDLVSALETSEGKGTTFYNHLNLEPSASVGEITKAYRKKSLELHPDKNPGVKNIQERFARLGVISQILRSPEKRERYDFFHRNGVPKWRGTGYYYSRYRPTLLHTLIFLTLLTSLFHYLVQYLNYNRDIKRVGYFEQAARKQVGGKKGVNGEEGAGRRKVRVDMVEGSDRGGSLELVVKGDGVFLPHEDGSLTPLSDLATKPSYTRTWPFLLTQTLYTRILSIIPPSLKSQIPPYLLPADISTTPESPGTTDETTEKISNKRAKELRKAQRRSATSSPATTEVESGGEGEGGDEEDGEEGGEVEVEGEDGERKKKKKGLGKAGGMRRRKMAMKK